MEDTQQAPDRPTLAIVAAAAGVSQATVSKVLNQRADVANGTRRRVEQLLRDYDYARPGGAVDAGSADVVDLVIDGLDSPWAVEILRGIESECNEHGVGLMVSRWRPEADGGGWAMEASRHGSRGVILVKARVTANERARLREAETAVVVVDPVETGDNDIPSIGATNWSGGLAATEHLLGLGHRRIAAIGGPAELMCSRARVDGYRAAFDRWDVADGSRDLVRYGDFSFAGGYHQARDLLSLPDRPTAIFAGSDQQALGVYEAARQAQLRIPEDLSVVGFDDLPLSEWVSPPLTTVRQPLEQMGRVAAGTLLRALRGRHLFSSRVELATELQVRLSTAPPPNQGGENAT